jgi:hypothetical protein
MPLYPHLAGSCITDDSGNWTLELQFGMGGICPPGSQWGGQEYPPDMRVFKMTRQLGLRVRDRTSQSLYFMRMLQPFPWVPKDDPVKSERAVASAGANWAGQSAEREKRRKKKEKKRRKELLQEQADEKAFMDWLTAPRQQPNGHAHSKCTPGACASPLLGGECSVHVHVGLLLW